MLQINIAGERDRAVHKIVVFPASNVNMRFGFITLKPTRNDRRSPIKYGS